MSSPGPDWSDAGVEEILRSALQARTDQISEQDLRPAQIPVLPAPAPAQPRTVPGRRRRLTFALAAAAATTGVLALGAVQEWSPPGVAPGTPGSTAPTGSGPRLGAPKHVAPATGPGGPHYRIDLAGGPGGNEEVSVSFTWHTDPVPGTAATTTYPLAAVSGADPDLRSHLQDTITRKTTALAGRYRARLQSQGLTERPGTQSIGIRVDTRWRHTVSIVLDVTEKAGTTPPVTSTAAVTLDARTGREVTAADLFTSVDAVDAVMRMAVRPQPATARSLTRLSMRPGKDGSTGPLAWYPTAEGLHWMIDPGVVAPADLGQPTAMINWSDLARLLKPGLRT
jgi:hypothetical protein